MPSGIAYSACGLSHGLRNLGIQVLEVNISEQRFWSIEEGRINIANHISSILTRDFSNFMADIGLCLTRGEFQLLYDSMKYTSLLSRNSPLTGTYVCGNLSKIISNFEPDIFHAHYLPNAYYASLLCKKLGIPLVTTVHGADIIVLGRKPLTRAMIFKTMEDSALVTAVSDELRILADRYGARICPGGRGENQI